MNAAKTTTLAIAAQAWITDIQNDGLMTSPYTGVNRWDEVAKLIDQLVTRGSNSSSPGGKPDNMELYSQALAAQAWWDDYGNDGETVSPWTGVDRLTATHAALAQIINL